MSSFAPGLPEIFWFNSYAALSATLKFAYNVPLFLLRRDIPDGAVQAFGFVPIDLLAGRRLPANATRPFQGFPFNLARRLLRTEEVDDLCLDQADDAFGQSVVVGISDAADRRIDPRLSQPLCVFDRQVLAASITVMDQVVRC